MSRVMLGDVAKVEKREAPQDIEQVWLLNLDAVEKNTGRIMERVLVPVDSLGTSTVFFDDEAILYSRLRPNLNKVILPDECGFATSEVLPLYVDKKRCCRVYLALFLRSKGFVAWASEMTAGAKMPRIKRSDVLSKQVPLPPIDEQERIVSQLLKVQSLQQEKIGLIERLDELVKSRFVEMFGDDKACEQTRLSNVCTFKSGTTLPKDIEQEKGELIYAKVADMNLEGNEKYITTSRSYVSRADAGMTTLPAGAVIFPKRGGAIGTNKKRILNQECCVDLNTMGVIPGKRLLTEYLYGYFQLLDLSTISNGSTIPQINNKDLAPLLINVPSIELQQDFALFMGQVDKLKFETQRAIDKLQMLYDSLAQEYFGGE